jgi:hypothetical protein
MQWNWLTSHWAFRQLSVILHRLLGSMITSQGMLRVRVCLVVARDNADVYRA